MTLGHILYFLVNASPKPFDVATSIFAFVICCGGYRATFCVTLGHILYFLVNASPKPFDVATSIFAFVI